MLHLSESFMSTIEGERSILGIEKSLNCVSFRAAADFYFVTLPDWRENSGTKYSQGNTYFDIEAIFTVDYKIQCLGFCHQHFFFVFLEYVTKCFRDRNSDLLCDWTRSQLAPSPTGKDRHTAGTEAQRQNV